MTLQWHLTQKVSSTWNMDAARWERDGLQEIYSIHEGTLQTSEGAV